MRGCVEESENEKEREREWEMSAVGRHSAEGLDVVEKYPGLC